MKDRSFTHWKLLRQAFILQDELEHLYRMHRQGLFSLALSTTGCRQMAEDAIQAGFANLCRVELNQIEDLNSYVFASVRNAARDALRQDRRSKALQQSIFEQHSTTEPEAPADDVVNEERNQRLRQVIDSLPANEREVIVLKIYSGLTFDAIGRVVNQPAKTVASRYRRTLIKLEEILRERP